MIDIGKQAGQKAATKLAQIYHSQMKKSYDNRRNSLIIWRPQGDLNPRYRRESTSGRKT
jgi:hypothetical protein